MMKRLELLPPGAPRDGELADCSKDLWDLWTMLGAHTTLIGCDSLQEVDRQWSQASNLTIGD